MLRFLSRFSLLFSVTLSVSLLVASPHAAAQTTGGVTGQWLGAFDVVHGDGSVEPGNISFSLAQAGAVVTGTAGESAKTLSTVSSAKISGQHLTFAVVVNPQMTVLFDLTLHGDHLVGTAAGLPVGADAKIMVSAVRADATWQAAMPVTHAPDRLFQNIAAMDGKLFEAYNTCDLKTLGALVADDLEFYHDKSGLAVGREVFVESIQKNICGRVRRELTPGSLEVHPLKNYGAVEIGSHRFVHPGHAEEGVGEAKFVMLWQFKDGEWKLTRVISYDHGARHE